MLLFKNVRLLRFFLYFGKKSLMQPYTKAAFICSKIQ